MDHSSAARVHRVMTGGDADGHVYVPRSRPTNIAPDFDWEGENVDALFDMTAKYSLRFTSELHQFRTWART